MTHRASARRRAGRSTRPRAREWLVADGLGGYAMGTVAGLRTRRYHGLLVAAVERAGGRMLGLAALDPVLVVGDARVRARDPRVGRTARSTRAATSCSSRSTSTTACRAGAGRSATSCSSASSRMAHGRPAVGVVHRLLARRPAGAARADAALHLARRPRRALRRTATPAVEAIGDGFVFEGAYRVAGAGWSAGGEWYRGVRAPRGGGARA